MKFGGGFTYNRNQQAAHSLDGAARAAVTRTRQASATRSAGGRIAAGAHPPDNAGPAKSRRADGWARGNRNVV